MMDRASRAFSSRRMAHTAACRPHLAPSRLASRSSRGQAVRPSAYHHEPFPWDESQYMQVQFMPPPFGPVIISKEPRDSVFKAVLVFQRVTNLALSEDAQCLEVFISGDTALGIYALLNGQATERPMALDVLHGLWQSARPDWKLLRCGIVGLQNDVFVARLFFGDPITGEVMWDCDCRPSDATFLAMKAGAPIFVARRVWDEAATRLKDSHAFDYIKQLHAQGAGRAAGTGTATTGTGAAAAPAAAVPAQQQQQLPAAAGAAAAAASAPDASALLPVHLLLRDLEEAVAQEDYALAARLRDHPWMRMHAEVEALKAGGAPDRAREVYRHLKMRIEEDIAHTAMSGDTGSFEAALIARARAEKQREAALRAMKAFRVVDHPPLRPPSRGGAGDERQRREGERTKNGQ